MKIAAYFGLLGVGVFIVPRVAMLSIMTLSDQYALVHSAEEAARLLAAGETLGALLKATPQTAGFFFMAIGVFTLSLVMLGGNQLNRITAWIGILACVITLADDFRLLIAPGLSTPLMIGSGLLWIPWWILIGLGLLRLAFL